MFYKLNAVFVFTLLLFFVCVFFSVALCSVSGQLAAASPHVDGIGLLSIRGDRSIPENLAKAKRSIAWVTGKNSESHWEEILKVQLKIESQVDLSDEEPDDDDAASKRKGSD